MILKSLLIFFVVLQPWNKNDLYAVGDLQDASSPRLISDPLYFIKNHRVFPGCEIPFSREYFLTVTNLETELLRTYSTSKLNNTISILTQTDKVEISPQELMELLRKRKYFNEKGDENYSFRKMSAVNADKKGHDTCVTPRNGEVITTLIMNGKRNIVTTPPHTLTWHASAYH